MASDAREDSNKDAQPHHGTARNNSMRPLTVSNYLAILQEDPDNEGALEGLLDALTSGEPTRIGSDPVRLLEIARGQHESRGEYRAAAWLLELEASLVRDDPDLEASLWKELGRLRQDELLDDAGAKAAYNKALELRPGDADVQAALEQSEQASANWREITNRFVQEGEGASDATLKTSLLTRAAVLVWQHKKRGKEKEADKLFRSALEADPGNTRAARLFVETLSARDQWAEVADVLVNAAHAARARDEKVNLYLRAARVLARKARDNARAATVYEQVVDFSPGHEETLRFLVTHYTDLEDWDRLVALYEDALRSRQKPESEQGILMQIGMVHWRIRGRLEEAEPYFARLRKLDPAHPGMLEFYRTYLAAVGDSQRLLTILSDAQRIATESRDKLSLAVELARAAQQSEATLERAIDAWKMVQRIDATNSEAHAALRDLYRRAEKWNALVEVLKAEIEALPPDATARRVDLLREIIPIYRDRLQLDVMVINTYNAILQAAPDDPEALAALARTYETMGRWNDLIGVLTRQADAVTDQAKKVELYMRVARLWIERFANYNQATRPLEQVVALDPDNRAALSELKEIYTKKRAWKQLFDVLSKEAELASDPAARLTLKIELAKLAAERLHRAQDAIALWREVVQQEPRTEGALDALERLVDREKDFQTLAEVLELRIEQQSDPKERIKILQKLGTVYAEHLRDNAAAISVWRRVLDLDPKNGRALRTLREAYVSAQDWEQLETLYRDVNDWEGLVDVFGSAAEKAESTPLKVDLSFRAARVYEEEIGEPHRAFRNYERVLAADPGNVRAARALIPIYERDEKWQRLAALYEVLLQGLPSNAPVSDKLELLGRLRTLAFDRLHDTTRAFEYATRAYVLAPEDAEVAASLESTAERANAHERLSQLYAERLDAAGNDERLRLRRRIAALAGERLGRPADATAHLERILEAEPEDEDTIETLDRLYRAASNHQALRNLYLHRVEYTSNAEEKAELLRELAVLEENVLQDHTSAAVRYRLLLDLEPEDTDALAALDRLAGEEERWDELASVLRRRRELASNDAEQTALTLRLGDLLRERIGDPRAALDAYADVLRVSPEDVHAVHGLEQLSSSQPALAQDAGRLLEDAYAARGAWDKLSGVLRARLETTKEVDERRVLRLRLAELSGARLGDPDAAYEQLEAAFFDRPDDPELWERLAEAAEAAGKHEPLARAYATAIEAGDLSEADVAELAARVAEIYDAALGRSAEAEPFLLRVLAHDPLNEKSFLALKELYTNQERWDELHVLYRNRIAQTVDAGMKLELLLQVCFLFEEILDNPELAVRAYQEVLELDPEHTSSRRALDRLYRRVGRWRDLATLLGQDLERATGQDAVDLTYELGALHETKLSEPGSAVDHYEAVLMNNPTHLRSQEALERLLAEPSQRQRIAAILEPLYDAQGASGELARVLEVQLEDVSDTGARLALLLRLAELHEHRLHDREAAFHALARAVASDPADASAREELARIASMTGRIRERADVLEKALAKVSDSRSLSSELLFEVARLWDEEAHDTTAADNAYTRLIELDPENAELVLPASRALERIHDAQGNHRALVEDLRRQVQFETDDSVRASLLVRLAALLDEKLGDPAGAIMAHRQRLELDPANLDALDALERMFEREQDWHELIGVLQLRDSATDDEEEQRRIARRVARVYEERLKDPENAIVAYNDVLARFGQDRETLHALAGLYSAAERWSDLLEILHMQHAAAGDPEIRAELRFRAAELMRLRTRDSERAIEAYAEVLDQDRNHAGAIRALEELVAGSDRDARIGAARVLVPRYEAGENYARLVGVLEVLAESSDTNERLRALRRAAEVANAGLESPERAFALMGRAVRIALAEPDLPEMLHEYERLAASAGRWREYVDVLREIAPDVLDGDLQTDLLLRLADVARTELGDIPLAREYYDLVLENRPEDTRALDALERLHTGTSDPRSLLAVLHRKAELADKPEQRIELLLRQARICEQELNDVSAAIDAYEQVLEEARTADAFVGLERLYERANRWDDLSRLYERQLEANVGDPVELRYKLGSVHLERMNEPEQALVYFRDVLARRTDHTPTIAALEGIMGTPEHRAAAAEILEPVFLSAMNWPKVTSALEARLEAEDDLDTRKTLLRRLGQIHEEYLEDLEGALETYARLFREDPTDEEVRDTLGRLAKVLDRWERLAEIYGNALTDVSVDDPASANLAFTTGQIYDQRTGDLEKAAAFYQRALAFDPTDPRVFEALESVYERLRAFDSLLSLYEEQVDIAQTEDDRSALLHKMARIREAELESPDEAIDTYREVLEMRPYDAVALEKLDELFVARERWSDLAEHLRNRINAAVGTPDEMHLKHRLGKLLYEKLDDKEAAIDVFEDIAQMYPDYRPTIESLEVLVQDLDHRMRITRILEPTYRREDQWKKLIAIHEAQVELTDDPHEKVRLLREIGRLHEERGRNGAFAFDAYARAFVEDPHDAEVQGELDRLATLIGNWDDHVKAYERASERSTDPILVGQLLATIARVHDEKRGDPRSAIETYQRLLAHDPDDPTPLDALEALHTLVGDWAGLVEVLMHKSERTFAPPEKGELLRRAGSVLEELIGDRTGAIEAYRKAVQEDDTDEIALEALDRLYTETNDSTDLAGVLARRVELEGDQISRIEHGLRLAELLETELHRPTDAIDALQRVLEDDPENATAVLSLGRLYERQAMWPELLTNLRTQAALVESIDARVALLYRSGEVLERELDDMPEAINVYREAIELDSRHGPSLEALLRISSLEDYRSDAAAIAEPLLREQGRWDDLARLIESNAEATHDPFEKRGELRRLAEVHEQGRKDHAAAFDALRRALAEDPSDGEAADELERIAGQLGNWDRLADTFAARASTTLDANVSRQLYGRLARIAEERLGDEARAIEAYTRIIEQVGDEDELLAALERLYERTQSWPDLTGILERRILLVTDDRARNDLLVRLGQIREEKLQDREAALAAYRDVLESDPAESRALAALERFLEVPSIASDVVDVLDASYRQTGTLDRVASLYDVRIGLADTEGERVRLLQELAALRETELDDAPGALAALRNAFRSDPRDETLLADIERLAAASNSWESLRGLVEGVSEGKDLDASWQRELNQRAAVWYRDHLKDFAAAEARLREAVRAEPDAGEAHEQLVMLLSTPGREAERVAALRAWASVELDDDARKERLREAARLAEGALHDVDTAAECYEALLAIDSSDIDALDDLARIRSSQMRWEDLVALLERRVDVEPRPEQRLVLRHRVAELFAGKLESDNRAMEAYDAVLSEEPTDLKAMEALERLYEKHARWEELRSLLDRRLDVAENDEQRISARVRLARLVEQAFGRRTEAIEQLREILEIDPKNEDALNELERLLVLDEDHRGLVDVLEQRAKDAEDDPAELGGILTRLARVYEESLNDPNRAASIHERVLEQVPDHEPSLSALVRLYENSKQFTPMASALERLQRVQTGAEATETAHRLADIAERELKDVARAEAALRRAYEVDPRSESTRALLEAFYQRHGQHLRLAEVLAASVEQTDDAAQQVAMLRRIANLYEKEIKDPGEAAKYLERAAQLVPNERQVLLPLCDLYIAAGRQREAIPVLEKIIASYGNRRVKELAQYHHKLGQALEGLGDRQAALDQYDAAFKVDLTNVEILRDLGKIRHALGDHAGAQKAFRALLLQKLDASAGISKADVYFYLGDISAQQGDKPKAVSMLERAIAEQSDHAEARALLTQLKS